MRGASLDSVVKDSELPFYHIFLEKKPLRCTQVLADLAWSEPRTFRSLVEVAKKEANKDPDSSYTSNEHVILESPSQVK